MKEFAGKGAVVTGAASGIGRGIARALAERGMKLALLDIEAEALRAAREEIAAAGAEATAHEVDVADRAAMYAAAERAGAALGRVHVLCNNAGVGYAGVPLDRVPDGDWDWVIGVNLMGVVNGIQAFLPLIKAHGEGGHIVNTASIGGHHVMPGWGHGVYSTSKFAVVGLSEALKDDLEPHGIGVSVLCPAAVGTAIYDGGRNRPARFGGPFRRPADHPMVERLAAGMASGEIGRWVVRAIEDQAFYIFTHPETRELVERRHGRIQEAYDWARRVAGEITAPPTAKEREAER